MPKGCHRLLLPLLAFLTTATIPKSILCLLALSLIPSTCHAAVPKQLGELHLKSPIIATRVTSDGKKAVLLVQGSKTSLATIQTLDIADPSHPLPAGKITDAVSADGPALALSSDGKLALIVSAPGEEDPSHATPRQIVAVDLSEVTSPKILWRRDIIARGVSLAPNASAYAAMVPSDGGWRRSISWLQDSRRDITFPESSESDSPWWTFSSDANLLAWTDQFTLTAADVHGKDASLFSRAPAGEIRYSCAIPLLNNHLLVVDSVFPLFGIYAVATGLPRVATLDHPVGRDYCTRLNPNSDDSNIVLADDSELVRIDAHRPDRPLALGRWVMPPDRKPLAASEGLLFAEKRSDERVLTVLSFDDSVLPDWRAAEKAHAAALKKYYAETKDSDPGVLFSARKQLEDAIMPAIEDVPLTGISPQRAAAILNDYAFIETKESHYPTEAEISVIEQALRRAIALDPNRSVAYLNLADLLRDHLLSASSFSVKQERVNEIKSLYEKYLALGGTSNATIRSLLSPVPESADICEVIKNYANVGRLEEILYDRITDLQVGGRRLSLVFGTGGTAHVPYMAAFDAVTGDPAELSLDLGDYWGGDHLGLVLYHDTAQILYYKDMKHPVSTIPVDGGTGCGFTTKFKESVGVDARESELCGDLRDGKGPASIEFSVKAPVKIAPGTYHWLASGAEAGNMQQIDFTNSGRPQNVVEMSMSSSAGAGCGETYYDLLDKSGKHIAQNALRDQLMRLQNANLSDVIPIRADGNVGACGNHPRFFSYKGKVYFENRPEQWPPSDTGSTYHRVARIDGGKVSDVCDFSFSTTVDLHSGGSEG